MQKQTATRCNIPRHNPVHVYIDPNVFKQDVAEGIQHIILKMDEVADVYTENPLLTSSIPIHFISIIFLKPNALEPLKMT